MEQQLPGLRVVKQEIEHEGPDLQVWAIHICTEALRRLDPAAARDVTRYLFNRFHRGQGV